MEPTHEDEKKQGQYDLVTFTDYLVDRLGKKWLEENESRKERKFLISKRRFIRYDECD
jgi:hypothetical protein